MRPKLSDQIFAQLHAMLASGELEPGDTVPSERALMARFGVGRPVVREALQALHGKGLITIAQGERSRVNAPSAQGAFRQIDDMAKLLLSSAPDNIEHLKQMRHMLELGTIALAAENCTARDAAELAALIGAQRAQLGHAEAFMQADIAFHSRIAQISGNPIIHAVTQMMLTWLFDYHASLLLWSGHEHRTLEEHEEILRHLSLNDKTGAKAAMEAHLTRSKSNFTPQAKP